MYYSVFAHLLIYSVSFLLIWQGSGMIIQSVHAFSRKLKFSPFAVSFILLGLLTSVPEFSVGLQSVSERNPEIFIVNLIGGITVLFLFIIPLLAIFGKGISLKHELDVKTLAATLGVILAPSALILDGYVSNIEGFVMICLYITLLLIIERKHGIFDKENAKLLSTKVYSPKDFLKLIFGIGLVFVSSTLIVEKTLFFAELINIPAFYISLIVISLGTNLPEISIAIRAVISGKRDIAMGDYMGSAAANTLFFGVFTILSHGEVLTVGNYLTTFMFISTALFLFFVFSATKKYISQLDGLMLLTVYFIFLVMEFLR